MIWLYTIWKKSENFEYGSNRTFVKSNENILWADGAILIFVFLGASSYYNFFSEKTVYLEFQEYFEVKIG